MITNHRSIQTNRCAYVDYVVSGAIPFPFYFNLIQYQLCGIAELNWGRKKKVGMPPLPSVHKAF